jgi:hypothetical protein
MQLLRGVEPAAASDVVTQVPRTSTDALRLAIKLAVDAEEYERAAVVLDVLMRTTPAGKARGRESVGRAAAR